MHREWLPIAIWTAALALAVALWISFESMQQVPAEGDALEVNAVERLAFPATAPRQLPEAGWEATRLPDDWLHRGLTGTEVWYRTTIDLDVPPNRLWAILLPGVNLAAAAYFNGELVGSSLNMDEPLSQDWNRPLMFSIPNGILAPGPNVIHVRVRSYPSGHGFFAPFYLGPNEHLLPSFESRTLLQVHVSRFVTTGTLFVSLFLALIWWMKHSETSYGWLALATLFWGLHSLKYHVSDIPVSSFHWAAFLFVSAIGFCTSMVFFMHRFTGHTHRRTERLILAHGAVATIVIGLLTAAGTDLMYNAAQIFVSVAIAIAGVSFVRMVVRTWHGRSVERYLVGTATLVVLVLGVRDWVLILGLLERPSGQLTQYAIPLLLGVLGVVLVNRFVLALRTSEETTELLEQRVREKSEALERNFERMRELERERVLAGERERLMRDMHDGVGGHLVSSLALLKSRGIEDRDLESTLSSALTDLRLMIDSLDTFDDDLNGVLGMLRDRMQRGLEANGISVDWRVERLPLLEGLGHDDVLQILRILQEALTNVIRHSAAKRVEIRAFHDASEARVCIQIRDDGRGIAGARKGRGLLNMRSRAQRLGAALDLASDATGTSVALSLPARPSSDVTQAN